MSSIFTPADFDKLTTFLMTTLPVADQADLYTEDYGEIWTRHLWNYGKAGGLSEPQFAVTSDPRCLLMMTATIDETLESPRSLRDLLWKCIYTMHAPSLLCSSYISFADAATLRFVTVSRFKLYTGMMFIHGTGYEKLFENSDVIGKNKEQVPDSLRRYAEPYIS